VVVVVDVVVVVVVVIFMRLVLIHLGSYFHYCVVIM